MEAWTFLEGVENDSYFPMARLWGGEGAIKEEPAKPELSFFKKIKNTKENVHNLEKPSGFCLCKSIINLHHCKKKS